MKACILLILSFYLYFLQSINSYRLTKDNKPILEGSSFTSLKQLSVQREKAQLINSTPLNQLSFSIRDGVISINSNVLTNGKEEPKKLNIHVASLPSEKIEQLKTFLRELAVGGE